MVLTSQVVILAGGLGTRLRPITETIPKPLVEVAGRPFLTWQLQDLKRQGFRRVLLLVGYLGQKIQDHYGDGSSMDLEITYAFEHEPLGTGGAVKAAMSHLDETFILLNGDSFQKVDLSEMASDFMNRQLRGLISTYDNQLPTPVVPNLKVKDGLVTEYKKGGGIEHGFHFVDSGVYVLNRDIFGQFPAARFQLEQLWPDLVKQHRLGSFAVNERFYDIGTPERLKQFEEVVRDYL